MKKISVAIIGLGERGKVNLERICMFPDVEIAAVCDVYPDRCEAACDSIKKKTGNTPVWTTDYQEIIRRGDVDVVTVFSSWETHIRIAVDAMRHKKIVGLEVGGALSLDECWELVNAYEETKTPIMFLENCCYGKNELLVRNMVRAGLFGEVVHCHGAYAHDLRAEIAWGKENRHYRLYHYLNRNCENYPTHDLGPIAKILDINRGNKMTRLVSVASKAAGVAQYISDRQETFENKELIGKTFKQGDVVNTLITCERGETISLTLDTTLPRSYSREFTVRGTKGMYEENTNSVFLDGDEEEFETVKHYKKVIDNAKQYEEKYLPDYWRNITPEQLAGHGGMDYFMFYEFFKAIRENRPMPIDVYDAASWMAVTALSEYSIANGNIPVKVPDFTKGAWMKRERLDV
ncbi:MAG: Gfo/Idh/MocA family oxidoreductase [Clostridia bacterium]|nr:Gfo/Idh/MocA family oxidoreductase [Clostridia bacterium]